MCCHPLHPFLAALPKCEHHIHLEGSLSPSLLFSLAARNGIALPADDAAFASPAALLARYDAFASLDDFLGYYYVGMTVLVRPADFEALAWEYLVRAHADGVVHAELFFDPQAHTARGIAYDAVLAGFTAACRRAERELGISTLLILCFLRHLPAAEAMAALADARPHLADGTLAGVGLDSSERGFPPALFEEVYRSAAAVGRGRRTAHAGEEGGPESVRDAIRLLEIERIDHGIAMRADEALMEEVADQGLLVTVCPLSNVRLRCVGSVAEVPIRTFLDKGVRFSINSDDPAYFGGYILANYCAVQEAFDLTVEEWGRIAKAGIEGSWCDAARKQALLLRAEEVIQRHSKI
jgi:adenosine deaminase